MEEIRIFVISLKNSTRRRQAIQKQLDDFNLPFEFIDAVDTRQGIPDKYQARCDKEKALKRLGREMVGGEWGCALSHALCYDKIVKDQIKHSLILEDDAILSQDFKMMVKSGALTKTGLGFISFFGPAYWPRWQRGLPFFKQYVLQRPYNRLDSALAYYLDLTIATKLHDATRTISYVADWPINTRKHRAHILVPFIVDHPLPNDEQSLIEVERETILKKTKIPFLVKLHALIYELPAYTIIRDLFIGSAKYPVKRFKITIK